MELDMSHGMFKLYKILILSIVVLLLNGCWQNISFTDTNKKSTIQKQVNKKNILVNKHKIIKNLKF